MRRTVERTVKIILRYPLSKKVLYRFTMVPVKPGAKLTMLFLFLFLKIYKFKLRFLCKSADSYSRDKIMNLKLYEIIKPNLVK